MRGKVCIIVLFLVILVSIQSHAQSQYVQFTASNLTDAAGTPLQSGTLTLTPITATGAAIAPHLSTGGRAIPAHVVFKVINGAIVPITGSAQLADVSMTNPSGFCYQSILHDNVGGNSWTMDSCLQPAYSATWCSVSNNVTTCNYDNYVPTGTSGALVVAGPAGITWQGAWSNSNTYAIGQAVSYNGSSYVSTISANTSTPGTAGWSLVASAGLGVKSQ